SFQFSWLAHLDLFRFCFLSFGQCYLENSILVGCTDLTGIHTGGERDAAAECTDVALSALSRLTVAAFAFSLAADRQRPVIQGNVDDFLAHSGQLDHSHEMVATLVKIECGRPPGKKLTRPAKTRPERHIKERVQLVP